MNNPPDLEKETKEDENEDNRDDDDRGVNELRLTLLPHHEGAGHQEVGFVRGIHLSCFLLVFEMLGRCIEILFLWVGDQHASLFCCLQYMSSTQVR